MGNGAEKESSARAVMSPRYVGRAPNNQHKLSEWASQSFWKGGCPDGHLRGYRNLEHGIQPSMTCRCQTCRSCSLL